MNGPLAIRVGLVGVLFALAGPAAANAPAKDAPVTTRFKTVETWGWKAQIPDYMEQIGKERTDPRKPQLAKWVYWSDGKSVRIRITTRQNVTGKKFKDIATYNYLKFVKKKPNSTILRMRPPFKTGKRKVSYFISLTKQIRDKKEHKYLYLRLVVRAQRALAYIQLGVAESRFNEFVAIAETLVDSFNLAEPASVAKQLAKKGGKVTVVKDLPPEAPAKAAGKK